MGCITPWDAYASPRWILFTDVTPDGHVDPPLLPRPMVSTAASGDPSPAAQVTPLISRVVTDCWECCCSTRVWIARPPAWSCD
jgi:hypothetical protein